MTASDVIVLQYTYIRIDYRLPFKHLIGILIILVILVTFALFLFDGVFPALGRPVKGWRAWPGWAPGRPSLSPSPSYAEPGGQVSTHPTFTSLPAFTTPLPHALHQTPFDLVRTHPPPSTACSALCLWSALSDPSAVCAWLTPIRGLSSGIQLCLDKDPCSVPCV